MPTGLGSRPTFSCSHPRSSRRRVTSNSARSLDGGRVSARAVDCRSHVERPRRANASQRSARMCCYAGCSWFGKLSCYGRHFIPPPLDALPPSPAVALGWVRTATCCSKRATYSRGACSRVRRSVTSRPMAMMPCTWPAGLQIMAAASSTTIVRPSFVSARLVCNTASFVKRGPAARHARSRPNALGARPLAR
jgi:hypothetical protein